MTFRQGERRIEVVINDYLKERPTILYSNFLPNIQIAMSAIEANEIDEEDHRWRGNVIRDVIRRVAAKLCRTDEGHLRFEFCENPKYRATLNRIYDAYRDERGNPKLANVQATESIVIDAAVARSIALDDEQGILDLVAEPNVWNMLPKSREHERAVQVLNLRESRIVEMTSNRTKPFNLRTATGASRRFDTAGREIQFSGSGGRRFVSGDEGFDGMSDEQLAAIYSQWSQEQKYKSMSTEELRAQVRQQGKERFEQKFHADPITGQPVAAATTTTEPLVDPRDGSPLDTKRKLVAYINSSYPASRILLAPHGKIIEARAREYERLINQRD